MPVARCQCENLIAGSSQAHVQVCVIGRGSMRALAIQVVMLCSLL